MASSDRTQPSSTQPSSAPAGRHGRAEPRPGQPDDTVPRSAGRPPNTLPPNAPAPNVQAPRSTQPRPAAGAPVGQRPPAPNPPARNPPVLPPPTQHPPTQHPPTQRPPTQRPPAPHPREHRPSVQRSIRSDVRTQTIAGRSLDETTHRIRPLDEPPPAVGRSALAWIAPIGAAALVTWELAAVLAVLLLARWSPTDPRDRVPATVVMALAALVILATSLRWRGVTAVGWLVVALKRRGPSAVGSPANALAELLPELDVRTHLDRAGNRAGLAVVADGSYVGVVRVTPSARTDPATLAGIARSVLSRKDIPLTSVQLVEWTVPSPLDPNSAAAAVRVYWLAVRYRPADAPRATEARGGGEIGALRATGTATFVLARDLVEAGHEAVVLSAADLGRSLLVCLGCDAATVAGSAAPSEREWWRGWSTGIVRQACFRPAIRTGHERVFGRFTVGAAFVCTSLLLRPARHGRVRETVVVRVGADPDRTRLSLPTIAAGLDLPLAATNGRHRRLGLGTLPLAG